MKRDNIITELEAIRELMADHRRFFTYGYDWRAERRILPNDFGRTRPGVAPSIGCLIAKRREAGKDFSLSEAGLKLLVEREGQDGAPERCYVLLRDETGVLINSTLARDLYARLKDRPTNAPMREGLGTFWWIDAEFNFAVRGGAARKDDVSF